MRQYLFPLLSDPGCLTSLTCLGPTMPAADFCHAVRNPHEFLSHNHTDWDTGQISLGKTHIFMSHTRRIYPTSFWCLRDFVGFGRLVPLMEPSIRFLFVES